MNANDYDLIADILRFRKDAAQFPAERIFLHDTMRCFGDVFSGSDRHFDRHRWELRTEIGPDMARDHYRLPPPRRRMEHPPLMATAAPQAAANDPHFAPYPVNWLDEINQMPNPNPPQAQARPQPTQADLYARARQAIGETMLYGAPLEALQQAPAELRPGSPLRIRTRRPLPSPFVHTLEEAAATFLEEHVEEPGDTGEE